MCLYAVFRALDLSWGRLPRLIVAVAVGATALAPAIALGHVWDGGGDDHNWSTAANWVGDEVPVSGLLDQQIVFGGTASSVQDIGMPFTLTRLVIDESAGNFSISGDALRFLGGAYSPEFRIEAPIRASVFVEIEIVDSLTISSPRQSSISFYRGISGDGLFVKQGDGEIFLGGISTYTGGAVVYGGVLSGGSHTLPHDVVNYGVVDIREGQIDAVYPGNISGPGEVRWGIQDSLTLTGELRHTGDTLVYGYSTNQRTFNVLGPITGSAGTLRLTPGVQMVASASISQAIEGASFTNIEASDTDVALGNPNSLLGFQHAGGLRVGHNTVSLRSKGFALLGSHTRVAGGTLAASNGIAIGTGSVVSAAGAINAKIAAGFGSTISAEGDLFLGDAGAFDGFFSDGVLLVGDHVVTVRDRNQAVLGSSSLLDSGTLAATNGLLLEASKNVAGYGVVDGPFENEGFVEGIGPAASDALEFSGRVTGTGEFVGNVLFSGVFAPGNSPGAVDVERLRLTDTTTMELEIGGTTPGTQFDLVRVSQDAQFAGTLDVKLVGSFLPQPGQRFDVVTYGAASGQFANVIGNELGNGLWLAPVFGELSLSLVVTLAGDATLDGTVGHDDLAIVVSHLGTIDDATWAMGDFSGDGEVSVLDLMMLQSRFGSSGTLTDVGASPAYVPEPSTAMLVVTAFVLMGLRRGSASLCVREEMGRVL